MGKKSKSIKFKVKAGDSRNELHFEIQLRNRAVTFKPKKGKGSFRRRGKHRADDEW